MSKLRQPNRIDLALSVLAFYILQRNADRLHKLYPQLVSFSFDYISNSINIFGRYENQHLVVLEHLLKKNCDLNLIIDVGANIGNHTLFFADFFNQVISLEPNDRTYKLLSINVFGKKNINCFNIGASSIDGEVFFSQNSTNIGASRIVSESESGHKIKVVRLDGLDINSEKLSCIKMDVEGHEFDVIEGAKEILKKNSPILVLEQSAELIVEGSSEVIDRLKDYGYVHYYSIETPNHGTRLLSFTFIKIALEFFAAILFGNKSRVAVVKKMDYFEKKNYSMIVCSKYELTL